MKRILLLAAAALLTLISCQKTILPAEALAERIMGDKASFIRFETIESVKTGQTTQTCEYDVYEIETVGRHVVIRGNNANAMAVGLNRYLQDYCLTQVTWYDYNPVELPETLPTVPEKIRVESLLPYRFFLNYCTYGYTLPYWNWEQWERLIDWMALNGVNMPLALNGQEAVWQKVWSRFGMSDEQIRSYFTGPAHLPWHHMNNIDHWQSPLPQEWIDAQAELQKKILSRERELGMRPVLPGFAGHVPGVLAEAMNTELNTTPVSNWCNFGDDCRCTFLNPADPHFTEIQKAYIEEQTAMFGSDHIYSVDAFNEVDLPVWDTTSLAAISRGIYESLEAADPDAVWLQMAWMFQSFNWNDETMKAYLTAVPEGRLIMLDYVCDYRPFWKETDNFYGQDYIWCYIGNFGGATTIEGNFHINAANLDDCFANGGDSFKGIGSTLEGFGVNEPLYEHVMSRAWDTGVDVDAYLDNVADRHLGRVDEANRAFWHYMDDNVRMQHDSTDHNSPFMVRPDFSYHSSWSNWNTPSYDHAKLEKAEEILNAVQGSSDALAFDRANMRRQVLSRQAEKVLSRFNDAYKAHDREGAITAKDEFIAMLDSLTAVLRTRPEFSMDRWVEMARYWGDTEEQKEYYANNAKTITTVWGDSSCLLDYSAKDLDGLMEDYYKPRWEMFFEAAIKAFDTGRPMEDLSERYWAFECRYAGIK